MFAMLGVTLGVTDIFISIYINKYHHITSQAQ